MIFGIGLPRTGTSSLAVALWRLGFAPLHHAQFLGSLVAFNRWRGEKLLALADGEFDSFLDGPIAALFCELDAQYPGSRFIWTTRALEPWLESVVTHVAWLHASGENGIPLSPAAWTERYHAHAQSVRDYFAGAGDVLELNVCGGAGWPPLCQFLARPVPLVPSPHVHERSTSRNVVL